MGTKVIPIIFRPKDNYWRRYIILNYNCTNCLDRCCDCFCKPWQHLTPEMAPSHPPHTRKLHFTNLFSQVHPLPFITTPTEKSAGYTVFFQRPIQTWNTDTTPKIMSVVNVNGKPDQIISIKLWVTCIIIIDLYTEYK